MSDITILLASYPRPRPALPAAHARIYAREYETRHGAHPLYRTTERFRFLGLHAALQSQSAKEAF